MLKDSKMEDLEFKISRKEILLLRQIESMPWNDIKLCQRKEYKDGSFYSYGMLVDGDNLFYIGSQLYTDEKTDTTDAMLSIILKNRIDQKNADLFNDYDSIRDLIVFDCDFFISPKKIYIINEIMYCYSYIYNDLIRVDVDNALLIEGIGKRILITTNTSEGIWLETREDVIQGRMKDYDGIRGVSVA